MNNNIMTIREILWLISTEILELNDRLPSIQEYKELAIDYIERVENFPGGEVLTDDGVNLQEAIMSEYDVMNIRFGLCWEK